MNDKLKKMSYTAMFAAINFIVFSYGKINISISANSSTAIHLANAVVVLSSWLLGPFYGGLAGAIGLSIADVLDPRYIASAPKTFFLKFMIALISGSLARKMGLQKSEDKAQIRRITLLSAAAGLGFNVIFDPIVGYFYKKYILRIGAEAASIFLAWSAGVTALNAVICTFVSSLLYLALYKSFRKIMV